MAKTQGISQSMPAVAPGVIKAALEGAGFSKGGAIHQVPVDNVHVIAGFNPRFDTNPNYGERVEAIAQDMVRNGFIQTKPLAGFAGKDGDKDVLFVTDGHTRLAAVKRANEILAAQEPAGVPIAAVPMILKAGDTSMRALTIALVTENSGEKLTSFEQAVVVKRLMKDGMEAGEVASSLSMTERWVRDLIKLINAPKAIRDAVKNGKMAGTEALRIMQAKGVKAKGEDGKVIKGKVDYGPAEEEVVKILKKAEEKGKDKASRKDTDEGTKGGTEKSGVKMETVKIEFTASAGSKHDISEIASFKALFGDENWFKPAGTKITLTEDVSFKASISRPKKEDPSQPGADNPAPEKKLSKKEQEAKDKAEADKAAAANDVSDL